MTDVRRPRLITALSIIQMVLAAVYLAGIVNLCYLAATASGKDAADVADQVRGLLIGAAFCGAFAFGSVIAALGLWWQTNWGRWLAVVLVALPVISIAYAWFDDHDNEVLAPLAVFTILLIVYLLPAVGRALNENQSVSPVKENA